MVKKWRYIRKNLRRHGYKNFNWNLHQPNDMCFFGWNGDNEMVVRLAHPDLIAQVKGVEDGKHFILNDGND